ncbi:hypothetical protein [Nostoc sp. 'Lobaria pulmonaria (5183) cyanobiont']|uniref:hypothetical protein n=1 Tax=Nostoc sp. 'Lobaria pulmonaria (5183) cyanobiont' TaxID=1618022 RepID=UPI000CF3479B
MAVWTLYRTQEVLNLLSPSCRREFCDRLNLSQEEINHWDVVSRKIHVVFQDDGILSQYEGFDRLEFDVQPLLGRYQRRLLFDLYTCRDRKIIERWMLFLFCL